MAIQVGIGLSSEKDPAQAARDAVRQARYALSIDKINLALVFSTIEYAHPATLATIRSLIGPKPIVGCSSLAIMTAQGVFKNALAVALLSIPESAYFTAACSKNIGEQTTAAGESLGEQLAYGFKNMRRGFGLLFPDGFIRDGSAFLHGIQERLGLSLPIAGGSASDNLETRTTYQYFNSEVLTSGACGILWGGKINVGLGIKHGWQPLGKPRRVTRSKGNLVYEIDGLPPAQFYENYFGCDRAALKKSLQHISILYPIGIYLPAEHEYLLRNILSLEDDGTIAFQGNVPEGSDIRLMIGTKESCLAATRETIDEIKKNLFGHSIDFVLVFDAVSRYILLGRDAHKEIDILREKLGDRVPIIGIYTYGEQAPLKAINYQGRAYFHNQTISMVAVEG